jgi:hypothetical protein
MVVLLPPPLSLLLLLLSLLLILLPSSLQRLLLLLRMQSLAMSCLLLQPVAICPLRCRSLCLSPCIFALLLLPPPPLRGLSPLLLPLLLLLLLLLLLTPVPPLQPKLCLQLLPGSDGLPSDDRLCIWRNNCPLFYLVCI